MIVEYGISIWIFMFGLVILDCDSDLSIIFLELDLVLVFMKFVESCTDDEAVGCTDMGACNYNPDATEDDGSCKYEVDCLSLHVLFILPLFLEQAV